MAMCKAGVEIHFKPKPRQTSKAMATLRRFKRDTTNGSSCDKVVMSCNNCGNTYNIILGW